MAVWKDVSKETFERFVQYAYTGDYSIPKTRERTAIVPTKVNGVHNNINGIENCENVGNGVAPEPASASAPTGLNGVRERVDSLGSDETSELRDGSISEKLDDDGTILNQPTLPTKKHKKRAARAAALEKAAKQAALKVDIEAPQQLEPAAEEIPQPEPEPTLRAQQRTELYPGTPEPELISLAEPENPSLEQQILTADFHTLSYPLFAPRDNYEGTCEPSMDFEKDHSYSNVLLSHASLYLLGDIHLVDNLKALALFKLHKTLCTFELDKENIEDITDLARYAYSGNDNSGDEGTEGLRGLVCQYMAIHAKELSTDAKFMNLLVEGGQIVQDFIKMQLQRAN